VWSRSTVLESIPMTKFEGGLTILHEANNDIDWLNYVMTTKPARPTELGCGFMSH